MYVGRRRRTGFISSVSVFVSLLLLVPLGAEASELAEPEEAETGLREEAPWIIDPANDIRHGWALWPWPEGGRVFQLFDTGGSGWNTLRAYDSVDRSEVGRLTLVPRAWGQTGQTETTSGAGRHHTAAVDRSTGRVFVAYRKIVSDGVGDKNAPCVGNDVGYDTGCVAGIHVIDGSAMGALGKIPLELPTVEGARVVPMPRALEYSPPVPDHGWGGRVLMIVEEVGHGPIENSAAGAVNTEVQRATLKRNSGNIAYAIAFDPDTMRQEWAVRLEGCRNSRESREWFNVREGHPATIFRQGGPSPALYVGCHANSAQQGVVVRVPLDADGIPAATPVSVAVPSPSSVDEGEPSPDGVVRQAPAQEAFPGPDKVTAILSDAAAGRILMRVNDAGEVWWVFDALANQFIGTIGIGNYNHGHTSYGLDPDTGRLYVLAAAPEESYLDSEGGLYLADTRRNPLAQALYYPAFADPTRTAKGLNGASADASGFPVMSVAPRAGGETVVYQTEGRRNGGNAFRVLVDALPVSDNPTRIDHVVRTLDIDEQEGVTSATFDGTARGFGFRTILIGGAEGATRVGTADPVGVVRGVPQMELPEDKPLTYDPDNSGGAPGVTVSRSETAALVRQTMPPPDPCTNAQRELILAFAGPRSPAVVDASSARGETEPLVVDVRTSEDVEAPVSRCAPKSWQELWEAALVSRAPVEEPRVEWPFEESRSSCTTTDEDVDDAWNDPVTGAFASRVECSSDEVSGWGQARGVAVEGVSVGHALSSFRIYRDPSRGMVARVESIARGINVAGFVKIDMVRGIAESWANGRHAGDSGSEQSALFNPFNCDFERSAGTCFQRHIFGVKVQGPDGKGYACGPCGPEDKFIEGMNRALGAFGYARFREPDRELARGSEDGYVAAITKKDKERFADIVLNNDLLETMVPMLEIVRYAPHGRPSNNATTGSYSFGTPPKGRQVYQFAAVEVSSSYGIQCLLVYDEATNTCAGEKLEPGAIRVSLSDSDGKPLAGGAFEVRQDVDTDGVLGLKDTLLANGACVTADDGVGTCTLDNLQPGAYLVSQVAAPPGYAKSAEPFVVDLASGEQRTVAFTNVSNLSTVDLKAADENGAPVSGAVFAAYPDGDSDGKVAPDAKPAAECTTDGQGACQMKVPAGSYVLVQTSAPGGLEGIEPVPFTFASGGQVASVSVVNYPPESPAQPEGSAAPIDYTPPVDYSPPVEIVDEGYVPVDDAPVVQEPAVSVPERIGGTVTQVIRAPGDALRLLARDPKQAVAWTAALALFVVAVMAVRRRQQTMSLIQQ